MVLILVDVLVLDAILCIVDNVSRVTHRDSAMGGYVPPIGRGDKWGGTKPTWGGDLRVNFLTFLAKYF